MSYLDELQTLCARYGGAHGVTATTIMEHADECPALIAAVSKKGGMDALGLKTQSFGQVLRGIQGIQARRGGHTKVCHYSPVPNFDLRSHGPVGHTAGVGVADALLDAIAPGVYHRESIADNRTVDNKSVGCHSEPPCHVVNDKGGNNPPDHLPAGWEKDPCHNPALHEQAAPVKYHVRGCSTLKDGAGKVVQQWVKTAKDPQADLLEELFDAIKSLPESFSTAHAVVRPPSHVTDDLLVVYPVLDVHLGMLSWCEETGNSYDTSIAERLHSQAIKHLVDSAPRAKHAVVASLGDMLHFNDNEARTERSGNPIDTDSRFAKVLRVGVGIQRAMIDAALEKHEHVSAYFCVGNHDAQASLMLALGMELFYRNDPRVTICTSPAKFQYHRWGKCLFGFTHGDMVKSENLPGVMACDRSKDWGETSFRKFFVGHIHKERVLDLNGCKVEHYRTLAGLEAYAYNAGYRTDRGMSAEYYHREHGFIGNAYVPLSLLEAA
jgi:hypothetical protein